MNFGNQWLEGKEVQCQIDAKIIKNCHAEFKATGLKLHENADEFDFQIKSLMLRSYKN